MYPPDIDLDRTPISTFEQLATGSPTAGRRTLIIEDEPGIARDLRYVLGPPRETVVLRPRIGGDASDDVSRAKQNLLGEGVLMAVMLLTPGPLDDMAAAGLRGGLNITVRNMPHAAERAVGRAGFGSLKEARTALQEFGAGLERSGLPADAVQDTAHADRVIVPGFGKGGAVVYQVKNGTLELKTVLEWRAPP